MDEINIGAIFDRICGSKGITQEELGKRFKKTAQSMSQHRTNNTFDLRLLIEAFPDVDLNWLFKGSAGASSRPSASEGSPSLPECLQRVLDAGYSIHPRQEGITPET